MTQPVLYTAWKGCRESVDLAVAVTALNQKGWQIIHADVRELTLLDAAAEKIIEVLGDTVNKRSGITGLINAVRNLGACQDGTLLVLDNCDGLLDLIVDNGG